MNLAAFRLASLLYDWVAFGHHYIKGLRPPAAAPGGSGGRKYRETYVFCRISEGPEDPPEFERRARGG